MDRRHETVVAGADDEDSLHRSSLGTLLLVPACWWLAGLLPAIATLALSGAHAARVGEVPPKVAAEPQCPRARYAQQLGNGTTAFSAPQQRGREEARGRDVRSGMDESDPTLLRGQSLTPIRPAGRRSRRDRHDPDAQQEIGSVLGRGAAREVEDQRACPSPDGDVG